MLGRSNNREQAASLSQEIATAHTANTGPLLTIVGASAKLEGKFGSVIKGKGAEAVAPRPVHLVDGARAATTQR